MAKSPRSKDYKARHNRTVKTRFAQLRFSAKNRGYSLELTFGEYAEMIQNPCVYCGGQLDCQGHGLDRLDNNLGYVHGNVAACCGLCNKVKRDYFSFNEMIVLGKVIAGIKAMRCMMAVETEGGGQWRASS